MRKLRISDNRKSWQHFRKLALLCVLPVLTIFLLFLVSYFSGRERLTLDGVERVYYIHLPKTYSSTQAYPVVLVFHMRQGTAWMMEQITHFNRLADQNEFIVVYPDGFDRSWADGSQRYAADKAGIDDVQFVKTLLAELEDQYAVDSQRIYVSGFSNGGFFVHRLGCELAPQIAAIATVSGVFAEDVLHHCDPQSGPAVLMIHGRADQDLAWAGKPPDLAPVPDSLDKWLEINRCREEPVVETFDAKDDGTSIVRSNYFGCQGEADIVFYEIVGGGHKWPGGNKFWQYWLSGNNSAEIDASALIWEFFEGKTNE